MSFWDLSDGETAKTENKEFEVPGGNFDPIPDNSDVLSEIKSVKWNSPRDKDERFVEINWRILAPEQFKNREVFQKLWVQDFDPSAKSEEKAKAKRDKARQMLATIDANAKGQLMASSEAPTDDSLALALLLAQMVIKCMIWEMPDRERHGEFIRGNWVSAVKPKTSELHVGEEKPKTQAPSSGGGGSFDLDDEIPF
jgi:hypothetical protein